MAAYQIGLLPRAAAEVETITAWWRRHRLAAPSLFLNELTLALAAISSNPEVGRKIPLRAYPDA